MSLRRQLVQIVPALSPPANGVGDYAVAVARALRDEFHVDTHFLVSNPSGPGPGIDGEFPVARIAETDVLAALERIEASAGGSSSVLLQLSPYGYDGNGCPGWLASGLGRWASGAAQKRLVTMFHELHASGPPWTRAFWLAGQQKKIARAIFRASSSAMTGVPWIAHHLEQWNDSAARPVKCLHIPSNVGEPRDVLPISARPRRICVFGRTAGADPLPKAARIALGAVVKGWSIEEIVLVGEAPVADNLADLGCPIRTQVAQHANQIGAVLMNSVLALSWYPAMALGKSSAYGAYTAHGVPTLVMGRADSARDLVKVYLLPDDLRGTWPPALLQQVADSALQRYQQHSVREHASAVAQFI
jgi:hypothetical protein